MVLLINNDDNDFEHDSTDDHDHDVGDESDDLEEENDYDHGVVFEETPVKLIYTCKAHL